MGTGVGTGVGAGAGTGDDVDDDFAQELQRGMADLLGELETSVCGFLPPPHATFVLEQNKGSQSISNPAILHIARITTTI